jgi:hypothetical protein
LEVASHHETAGAIARKPAFWVVYAAVAGIALAVAAKLFPLAIPLVNLEIKLSRHEAIAKAEALAATHKLAPEGARSAARFAHDGATQNYVELMGGGKAAFAALVSGNLYAPYWWDVRLFRPGNVNEVTLRFKPDGAVDGFSRRLPEDYVREPATKALEPDKARELAVASATKDWNVDFSGYTLLEQSQQTRPTGRVDHDFVYERANDKLGDARIRLKLSVDGDELTEVSPFVHIPEAFERRFSELRSANDTIAGAAALSAGLLYGLGGCVIGVLWLARRHWLLPRPALAAGLVVGSLLAAASLSGAPASWFGFDTAQSATVFWMRQAGAALAIVLLGSLGYTLVFMAAEGLTRRAFAHQPQLWRLWSRDAGTSRAVLGRTVGAYLFVPLELALISAFYLATNHWLDWWQPSEVLTDPNILSASIPALAPIALSLQAGFMEECLFRAIPLALGALIGARFGHRTLGIGVAFVLQAVIFGAAHANYPGFPPYSRLVELVVPSMIWAAIFLRFGLLSTILLHALYDLTLFSIPLYLVDAAGASIQRALVIVAALVPIGFVLWRRTQVGAWRELPDSLLNGAWSPPAAAPTRDAHARDSTVSRLGHIVQRFLPLLGLGGFVAWAAFTPMHADVQPLAVDRAAAEKAADDALQARGVVLGPEWRRMSVVRLANDAPQWTQHKFVWREAGPATYHALVGPLLAPPVWEVRYAMFDGDVSARAEEWRVTVEAGGHVRRVRHDLPEAKPGARLSKEAALNLAEAALAKRLNLDPSTQKLIAAEQVDRPARTDWLFTFSDPHIDVGDGGEARALIAVGGDEIVGANRFVYIPEPWLRSERETEGRLQIAKAVAALLFAVAAVAALIAGIRRWLHGDYDSRAQMIVLGIVFATSAATLFVMWPIFAIKLDTSRPVASQVLIVVAASLIGGALSALLSGLVSGVGVWAARTSPILPGKGTLPPWVAGTAAALFVAGASAFAGQLMPAEAPLWPALTLESAASPSLAAALEGIGVVSSIGAGLFLLYLLERVTASWTRRFWLAAVVVVAVIAGRAALKSGEPGAVIVIGLIAGLIAVTVLYCVLRFDARALPGYVVVSGLIGAAENAALTGTPTGWVVFGVAAVTSIAVGLAATRYIGRPLPPRSQPLATAAPSP